MYVMNCYQIVGEVVWWWLTLGVGYVGCRVMHIQFWMVLLNGLVEHFQQLLVDFLQHHGG